MFRKVYTYLKRQTLPTSLLLKNRLLVERQWKHRRIMSNFGTTFRNSKWSDYSSQNITPRMNIQLFSLILKVFNLLLILILISVGSVCWYTLYLSFSSTPYFPSEVLYELLEGFVGSIVAACQLVPIYGLLLLHLVVEYGLVTLFLAWSTSTLPKFFDNQSYTQGVVPSELNPLHHTYSDQFTLALPLQRNIPILTIYEILRSSILVRPQLEVHQLNPYAWMMSNTSQTVTGGYTNTLINDSNRWALTSIYQEKGKLETLDRAISGPFYLPSLDYNFLTLVHELPELQFTTTHLRTGLKLNKSIRWLYRYSMLHRKSIKRTHFLTLTKRFIASGFYGENMTNRNLWAAGTLSPTTFNSSKVASIVGAQYKLLYGNWRRQGTSNDSNLLFGSQTPLTHRDLVFPQLQFIERSFYFVLKRLHFFDTLPTTFFSSTVKLDTTPSQTENQTTKLMARRSLHWIMFEGLMSSPSLTLPNLNFDIRTSDVNWTDRRNAPWGTIFDTFVTTQDLTLWHETMCTTIFDLISYTPTKTSAYYYNITAPTSPVVDSVLGASAPRFTRLSTPNRSSQGLRPLLWLSGLEFSLLSDLRLLTTLYNPKLK